MFIIIKSLFYFFIICIMGILFGDTSHIFSISLLICVVVVPIGYYFDKHKMFRFGNFQTALMESITVFILIIIAQLFTDTPISYLWAYVSALVSLVVEVICHRQLIDNQSYVRI